MRTAVVGSRTITDYAQLLTAMEGLRVGVTEVITGGASGADALAER